jgi:hypothetical protein
LQSIATLVDNDNDDEKVTVGAIVGIDMAQKGMQTPQKFGSASSYGKKYSLGNLFLIDDTADADAVNTHGKGLMTKTQIIEAKAYLKKGGKMEAIKAKYDVTPEIEKQLI